MKLCIDKCLRHGYWAVSIEDDGIGTRLTPIKCCGSWTTVKSWNVDPQKLVESIQELAGERETQKEPRA